MTAQAPHNRETVGRPYDVEADWLILSTCNFRCRYCFLGLKQLSQKIGPRPGAEEIARQFDRGRMIWRLHITGGEPFLYPEFVRLCRLLTRRHLISVNSNLSSDRLPRFAEEIDPSRVDFINASLHSEEWEKRGGQEGFASRVRLLQDRGFSVFVTYVMHPGRFPGLADDFKAFLDRGVAIIPKALRGVYRGRYYPGAYTEEERKIFEEISLRAESHYRPVLEERAEPFTVNPFLDRALFMREIPDHYGRLCHAGQRFVRIRPDGDVWGCGPRDNLGNIFRGDIRLRDGPARCRASHCPYFCEKYLVQTDEKRPAAYRMISTVRRWRHVLGLRRRLSFYLERRD